MSSIEHIPVIGTIVPQAEVKGSIVQLSAIPPSAPTNLVATVYSPDQIYLIWAHAKKSYVKYRIYYTTDLEHFVLHGTTNALTYMVDGLKSGTLYYFYVTAYHEFNESDKSNIAFCETLYLPEDIDGLFAYYDIAEQSGLNDGDSIATLVDHSGNGLHITQSDEYKRAVYKTNIQNNRPSARFDGVDDWYMYYPITLNQPKTIFVIAKRLSRISADYILSANGFDIKYIYNWTRYSISQMVIEFVDKTTADAHILSAIINGENSKGYFNGGYKKEGDIRAQNGDRILIGRHHTGILNVNMDLFAFLVYDGAMSDAKRRKIEEWAAWKWGIDIEEEEIEEVFTHTEPSLIYVAPDGTGDGSTEEKANELQNVLKSGNVLPGDTIVLLDGIYTGNYYISVNGTAEKEIIIKGQNNESIIDGSLQIGDGTGNGAYVTVRNIQVTNTDTDRGSWETEPGIIKRAPSIAILAENVKVINCICHDGGVGIRAYGDANGALIYGNIVYNSGWAEVVGGQAQNIYIHSSDKTVKHCVFGGAFKKSVAVYTTNALIDNIIIEENVVFAETTLLFGGNASDGQVISGSVIKNHVIYRGIQLGYDMKNNLDVICQNNRVHAKVGAAISFAYFKKGNISGNKFVGGSQAGGGYQGQCFTICNHPDYPDVDWKINNNEYHHLGLPAKFVNSEGFSSYDFAEWQEIGYDTDSIYSETLPVTNECFVYPNEYPDEGEKRMGMVVIWNWEELETVTVDLTELGLEVGQTYRWRQAQDPLDDTDTWVCTGNTYEFSMTGHTVAKPIGFAEELIPTQFPAFGCFIIEKV